MKNRFMHPTPDIQSFVQQLYARYPRTRVTPLILTINVTVFVFMLLQGATLMGGDIDIYIEHGANLGPLTRQEEWWRLLTSTALHFGILHLAFNMWALWDAGNLTERLYGHAGFFAIYLYAGVFGSLASLYWHPGGAVSAGASGAVFGVFGALIAYLLIQRRSVPVLLLKRLRHSALFFTGFSLFYGFSVPGIDNAAHIGGLASGMLMGLLLSQPILQKPQFFRSILVHVICIAVISLAIALTPPQNFDYYAQKNAEQSIQEFISDEHRLLDEWKDIISEIDSRQDAELSNVLKRLDLQYSGWLSIKSKMELHGKIKADTEETINQLVRYAELRAANTRYLGNYLKSGDPELLHSISKNNQSVKQILDDLNNQNR